MTIGQRIRERRESLGITQVSLADAIGERKQTLYKYETGVVTNIPIDKIEAIASALQTTPASLMGWEEPGAQSSGAPAVFDDFTYAMYEESRELTPENRQKLLEMAQFFRQQQEKEQK